MEEEDEPSRRFPITRVGIFHIRAWTEGPDGHLVARITQSPSLADWRPTTEVIASSRELLERVRRWLEELQSP